MGTDVECGFGGRSGPWREPDQMSEGTESVVSLYHHHQQQQQQQQDVPVIRSTLEPAAAFRMDRLGEEGAVRGVAL